MTLFRLINASIKGAITGAKDAIILEKQFMAWESELEELEIFDGYQGWIEVDNDDIPDNAMVMCIGCDNIIKYDECEPFCKECITDSHKKLEHSEYHMDTCCIEATGTCNCDLPF